MMETIFCYTCRTHHPREAMHLIHTRHGLRWRCRRSIEAAQCSIAERDAFGRQQTGINRELAEQTAQRPFLPFAARRLQR